MLRQAKNLVHSTFKVFGYELVALNQRPTTTFMGLQQQPIQTIIDVGANRGQFSKYISDFFPEALIHAFEPLSGPSAALQEWGQKTNKRLVAHNTAVGNKKGTTQMQHHLDFTPSSSILQNFPENNSVKWQQTRIEQIEVDVTTLDDEFPNAGEGLDKGILLKLDVQGFEDRVLSGARELLPACSIVVVEHCTELLYKEQASFNDIYQHIQAAGLEFIGNLSQHHAKDGQVVFADAVFQNNSQIAA